MQAEGYWGGGDYKKGGRVFGVSREKSEEGREDGTG